MPLRSLSMEAWIAGAPLVTHQTPGHDMNRADLQPPQSIIVLFTNLTLLSRIEGLGPKTHMIDHFASALLVALSYLESRDVPDDIADDDVRVLEEVFFHLQQCSETERGRIAEAARAAATRCEDPRRQQSLNDIIANLQP